MVVMAPPSFCLHRTLVSTSSTTTSTRSRNTKARDTHDGLCRNSGAMSCSSSSSNRVLLHCCSSIRRIDAPVLATSDGEAEIASVQDGSIFFTFGRSPPIQSMKKKTRAEHRIADDAHAHSTSVHQPHSMISQFQKLRSPIPASAVGKKPGKAAGSPRTEEEAATAMPTIREKLQEAVKSDYQPTRLPSAFSKRSPIPSSKKEDERSPFSSSEKIAPEESPGPAPPSDSDRIGASANATRYKVDPTKDSTLSPALQEIVGTGLEFLMQEYGNSENKTELETETHTLTTTERKERRKNAKAGVNYYVEDFGTPSISLDENGSITHDLSSYKLAELRSLAKSRGLKGYSKLKKGELLDLLENAAEK